MSAIVADRVRLELGRRFAELAMVNGEVGAVVGPGGRLRFAVVCTVSGDRISAYEVVADAQRLRECTIAVVD